MSIRQRAIDFTIVLFCCFSTANAAGKLPGTPVQLTIDSLKALGETYQGALWHAVELQMYARDAATAAAMLPANSRDGGNGAANATLISSSGYQDVGTTSGKGNTASLPSCLSGGNDTAPDAWYIVTFSEPVLLTAWTTCGYPGTYDTRIGIFNSQLALVDCNDDDPACNPNLQSKIENRPLNAGAYYIVVDGYNGGSGPYQLNVTWGQGPEPCNPGSNQTNAEQIPSLPFSVMGTTVGSCDDIVVSCELTGPDNAEDYWYRVSLDTTTLLTVWTSCSSAWFDTKIAIFDSSLTQMYCNDDLPDCASKQSQLTNAALDPGEYFIVVDGYHSEAGDYEINVEGVPFNELDIDTLEPDIVVKQADLFDNVVTTDIVPGRRHLALTVTTPNIGAGKLYLYGVLPANGDGTQDVRQRVYRSDGSFFDRLAGQFIFHTGHNHIHVEDWTQFHLRVVMPDSSVGPIVASGDKTSFCILDLGVHDSSLPNFNPNGQFFSCSSTIQGLSVGWADTYSKDLPGQNIDITDVQDGVYWLVAEVDPLSRILEGRETNNTSKVLVVIGSPNPVDADRFEQNDDFDEVDARVVGVVNSPNLGPCDPVLILDSLNIHQFANDDYYKFYCNAIGVAGDRVRIDFQDSQGDLDLYLYNSSRVQVGASNGASNSEVVTLNGKPEGWYYARVSGASGATNPSYTLTINPPSNAQPAVTVVDPPAGDTAMIHGIDTYKVGWSFADPEADECWVTVYVDTIPVFDGDELMLPTSLHTSADQGFYIVNSAYVQQDASLYVYCQITDGGTTTGAWSGGTMTFLHQDHAHGMIAGTVIDTDSIPVADAVVYLNNHEHEDTTIVTGLFMMDQIEPGFYTLTVEHPAFRDTTLLNVPVNVGGSKDKTIVLGGCGYVAGDGNSDGIVNISDAVFLVNYIFAGGPTPVPLESVDADCNGQVNISDAVAVISYIFAGGPAPCRQC